MRLVTILNHVEKYKSFANGAAVLDESSTGKASLLIPITPRANSRPICSGCGASGSVYDHMPKERRFEYVPLWGIAVFFVYRMRRVNCRDCGVTVE